MMISLIKLLLLEILPPIEALYCFIYRDIFWGWRFGTWLLHTWKLNQMM
jgi:hypothetical protein